MGLVVWKGIGKNAYKGGDAGASRNTIARAQRRARRAQAELEAAVLGEAAIAEGSWR